MLYSRGISGLALGVIIGGVLAAAAHGADKTNFITLKEIGAMSPRTVTFAQRLDEFSGSFTNAAGAFVLGDIRGDQSVWHFVGSLNVGQTYTFPDVFTNYLAASYYVTAKSIAEMPPSSAVLASRSPCSSRFVTTEGRWFGIGDPGSGAEVSQFIWSLKAGQTNRFPEVFLNYQAAPRYTNAAAITAMAPRTGTLTGVFLDFCYFATADGKGFFIDPGNDAPEVTRFLRTLEEEKSYEFPGAFLKYQKGSEAKKP
jgi:hypothetical protein